MKNAKTGVAMMAAIALSAFMSACSGNKNNNHENGNVESMTMEKGSGGMMKESDATHSELPPLMASYMEIKDALASDNPEAAQKVAASMVGLPEMSGSMKDNLKGIAGSEDLAVQRKHFGALSTQMYQMAREKGMGKTLYWTHCPMAMNGEGASWLSMNEQISNPYLGQKMPKCGSVLETL